jgi:hypothetical protein
LKQGGDGNFRLRLVRTHHSKDCVFCPLGYWE